MQLPYLARNSHKFLLMKLRCVSDVKTFFTRCSVMMSSLYNRSAIELTS